MPERETFDIRMGGMSLRDWFAGQALAGVLGCPEYHCDDFAVAAQDAYADAMLVERARPAQQPEEGR